MYTLQPQFEVYRIMFTQKIVKFKAALLSLLFVNMAFWLHNFGFVTLNNLNQQYIYYHLIVNKD